MCAVLDFLLNPFWNWTSNVSLWIDGVASASVRGVILPRRGARRGPGRARQSAFSSRRRLRGDRWARVVPWERGSKPYSPAGAGPFPFVEVALPTPLPSLRAPASHAGLVEFCDAAQRKVRIEIPTDPDLCLRLMEAFWRSAL